MPKTRHIVAALLFTAAASFGQLSSPWNFTQDVARAESQQQPMQWFAAETLELNLWSRRLSAAVDFSDPGLKLLWEVVAQANVQTTWAATTGTVTTATNGAARYTLNNQQANLPAGSYLGFVRAVWTNGTITSNVVLQYQAITVKASANSGLYPVADPITQAYGITGAVLSIGGSVTQTGRTLYISAPGVFTSLVRAAGSSDRLTVTNGGGTQATINLNVSGLATDNQWRADTERVGLVASNALAGLPSLVALTQGVVNVGIVASNALAGLPMLAGLSNAVLAVGVSATNASATAEQAQVLGTNAYALALQAITNYVESGTGNAITGQVKSAQTLTAYRGTIAGSGSGSLTNILRGAGSSTRLSVSNGAGPQVTLHLDASAFATGTPVYVESDPLWVAVSNSIRADINSKGTGSVASLAGVTMQGGTHTGNLQAASSAGGHLSNMSGSNVLVWGAGGGNSAQFSGPLTVNGGSAVATGLPLYVITSNNLSGVDGSGLTNMPSAGGASTNGLPQVLANNNVQPSLRIMSDNIHIGGPEQSSVGFTAPSGTNYAGNVLIGGASNDYEGAWGGNSITGAAASVIIGGADCRISSTIQTDNPDFILVGGIGGTMYNNIIGSHGSEILASTSGWAHTKYIGMVGVNNMHIKDSSFVGIIGSAGGWISNATIGAQVGASHSMVHGPGYASPLSYFFQVGSASVTTSSYTTIFGGADYNDGVPYSDNGSDTFNIGMGSLWMHRSRVIDGNTFYGDGSGLTNLPGGGAITALSTNLDAAGNIISNVHIRGRSFVISDGLTVGSGTTNCFVAQPGVTIGLNARQCSVLGAGGIVLNNAVGGAIGGGTNNSVGAFFSVVSGGKDNYGSGNYVVVGGGAQNRADADGATIGGGWWNTNSAPYGTIGGGRLNRINAGGINAGIAGGATNLIDAPGGQIIGSSGWLTSTATNSVLITAAPTRTTNAAPNTVSIVAPASFSVRVGATTFAVSTGGVSGATGTGTWSITESGLIVNGVAK